MEYGFIGKYPVFCFPGRVFDRRVSGLNYAENPETNDKYLLYWPGYSIKDFTYRPNEYIPTGFYGVVTLSRYDINYHQNLYFHIWNPDKMIKINLDQKSLDALMPVDDESKPTPLLTIESLIEPQIKQALVADVNFKIESKYAVAIDYGVEDYLVLRDKIVIILNIAGKSGLSFCINVYAADGKIMKEMLSPKNLASSFYNSHYVKIDETNYYDIDHDNLFQIPIRSVPTPLIGNDSRFLYRNVKKILPI
jgi:hypothetical protein